MQENVIEQVVSELMSRLEKFSQVAAGCMCPTSCTLPEFVGVKAIGGTIGLVIPNVDASLAKAMKLNKP